MTLNATFRKLAALAVLSLSVSTGCRGWSIEPETPLSKAPEVSNATLVVAEITRPRDLVVAAGNPFYAAMQRALTAELGKAQVASAIMDERDLTKNGIAGPTYILRLRVVSDEVVIESTGGGCTVGLTVAGCFTLIPLFFLGQCTVTASHRLEVEARVFSAEGVAVTQVQDATSNELLNVFDTSSASPLFRKNYQVKLEFTQGVFANVTGDELLKASKAEAEEATRQVLEASIGDIARTMRGARANASAPNVATTIVASAK